MNILQDIKYNSDPLLDSSEKEWPVVTSTNTNECSQKHNIDGKKLNDSIHDKDKHKEI